MVPYNPRGLFTAMGGNATVANRLDTFLSQLNAGPGQPFAFMGNEPNSHVPWLYNYTGTPYKTQAITRKVMTELYNPHEDGLIGNDDLGQLSSWYVWAAMGMYPMIPGRSELVLNGPLFEQVVITAQGDVDDQRCRRGHEVAVHHRVVLQRTTVEQDLATRVLCG